MTVREISLGLPGLDRVLGGPLRLVERLANQPSTSILVRGGPGTGKTSLALHLAAEIAKQLDGDVLFASVEMLASELRAIYDGTSGEARLGKQVVDLAKPAVDEAGPDGSHATVWFANLDVVGRSGPEVHAALEASFVELLRSARSSTSRGVRAVVVDGLSDGYDLGSKAPRALADGLVKFAAQEGFVLVLVEETNAAALTHWSFAVDISLLLMNEPGLPPGTREMSVDKSRYSAASAGPHLYTMDRNGPAIAPHPSAHARAWEDAVERPRSQGVLLQWEPGKPMAFRERQVLGSVHIDLSLPESRYIDRDPPGFGYPDQPSFAWSLWREPRILLSESISLLHAVRRDIESDPNLRLEYDPETTVYVGDLAVLDSLDSSTRAEHLACIAVLAAVSATLFTRIVLEDSSLTGLARSLTKLYRLPKGSVTQESPQ
jgi:KaiC/GvpD/RAD55 family RecA-like ATPase